MKAFASWSGGKDCMLALHRYLNKSSNEMSFLVNMCDADGEHSRSHGLKKTLIKAQSESMGVPLIQRDTDFIGYEARLKSVISELKDKGVSAGVFGDIYLKEHRIWIERVCSEMEIVPVFPLWENDTSLLLKEFIEEGFKAVTVSVRSDKLSKEWLGRDLDKQFFNDIVKLENIDPCAENGEYHTFVYDGPIFKSQVIFSKGGSALRDDHYFLELN
jgi:uncharacterized protein (TIGR00290 family)